jgi:hypothetical protein
MVVVSEGLLWIRSSNIPDLLCASLDAVDEQ